MMMCYCAPGLQRRAPALVPRDEATSVPSLTVPGPLSVTTTAGAAGVPPAGFILLPE